MLLSTGKPRRIGREARRESAARARALAAGTDSYPQWTVRTARRHGLLRRHRLLLAAVSDPVEIGLWVRDLRWQKGRQPFEVLEHPAANIAPVVCTQLDGFEALAAAACWESDLLTMAPYLAVADRINGRAGRLTARG
jgi:hypothetical protein